jgi:SP family general alpha glucoside:H+ symporter-like MFS transporter
MIVKGDLRKGPDTAASSWFLMKPFGRRDLYLYGQATLVLIMLITAVLGTIDRESKGAQYGIGGLLILFTFVYDITIGPVCYALVAEIGSTRLRSKVS